MEKGHNNFTIQDIREVWSSIKECRGYKHCNDPFGRKMNRDEYGKQTKFGWNIDHVKPICSGGNNNINNLQPLNWKSNKEKGDKNMCEKWSRC